MVNFEEFEKQTDQRYQEQKDRGLILGVLVAIVIIVYFIFKA